MRVGGGWGAGGGGGGAEGGRDDEEGWVFGVWEEVGVEGLYD